MMIGARPEVMGGNGGAIIRTVHGPSVEGDATGRGESRGGAGMTSSTRMAWYVKWSVMAARRRLSFRPEFGT